MLSKETTNTNVIVLSLTPQNLELTTYNTWGKHANHYTTDTVPNPLYLVIVLKKAD